MRSSRLVHHSDRGVQYVSIRYSVRLAEAGIEPSVGSVGDSCDNALEEVEFAVLDWFKEAFRPAEQDAADNWGAEI